MSVVYLKPRKARPFFGRHPWVFESAVGKITGNPQPGDAVRLHTDKDEFVAYGIYNPHSKIRVRLYSWDPQQPIDDALIAFRLERAIRYRHDDLQLGGPRQACRLVYSESDGLSGLVVDRYADVLVVQVTSLAMAIRMPVIVDVLKNVLDPACIYRRTERGIGALEGLELADEVLAGTPPTDPLIVEEHGLDWIADIQTGQKTGMYLDQRDNRLALCRYTHGKSVLDVFCHGGAFSQLAVKLGGATSAVGIDVSQAAIELARRNAQLHGVEVDYHCGEAVPELKSLHQQGHRFGAVVCDPPKFARSAGAVDRALRAYEQINTLALNVLEPGGILCTCSCSGNITMDQFIAMLTNVSQSTGRELHILERRGQAPDHPVSLYCQETDYLKCIIARVIE